MPKKILVIDDNEMNRKLVRMSLITKGHEIIEAADGREGIEAASAHKPDLIIMDIQMPVIDGFAAIEIIKKDPATKDIKIIALTAYAMKGDRERILQSGCDEYMSKPIDLKPFIAIVERLLGDTGGSG